MRNLIHCAFITIFFLSTINFVEGFFLLITFNSYICSKVNYDKK